MSVQPLTDVLSAQAKRTDGTIKLGEYASRDGPDTHTLVEWQETLAQLLAWCSSGLCSWGCLKRAYMCLFADQPLVDPNIKVQQMTTVLSAEACATATRRVMYGLRRNRLYPEKNPTVSQDNPKIADLISLITDVGRKADQRCGAESRWKQLILILVRSVFWLRVAILLL